MRRASRILLVMKRARLSAVVVAVTALAGCGAQVEQAGSGTSSGASSSSGSIPHASGAGVLVRLANLGPYFSAQDLCVGVAGQTGAVFAKGPAVAAMGRPQGIREREVSAYVHARVGDVLRVIAAGEACDATSQFTDAEVPAPASQSHLGGRFTLIPVDGEPTKGATPLLRFFEDEPENPHYGSRVRGLQVLEGTWRGDVTITGEDFPGDTKVWYPHLAYARPGDESPIGEVSALGFFGPWGTTMGTLRVAIDGEPTLVSNAPFDIQSGDDNAYGVASVFITAGGAYVAPSILACSDNAPGVGGLSVCSEL